MTRLEPIHCPECHGTGITETYTGVGGNDWAGYYPNYSEAPCETCEGQGEMWMVIHPAENVNEVYWDLDSHDMNQYWTERMAA